MSTIEDYKNAGKEILAKLRLSTFPLGITYLKDDDKIPDKAMQPSRLGAKMAICQAFTQARRWGTAVAITADDNFCTPSSAMHGWAEVTLDDLIESQLKQGWHANREAEERRFEPYKKLLGGSDRSLKTIYRGLICYPLERAIMMPDSVLIYCYGPQLTHIVQALSYEYKYVPRSSFEGFAESCLNGALLPFVNQRPEVVIPGMGDRSFGGIMEDELGVGMPAHLVFYVLEHLFKTGGIMNIGYPQKTMLATNLNEDLTPGFRYLRDKMESKKQPT